MAQLFLALTDGTTTITIADGAGGDTNYRLKFGEWAPRVARRSASMLANRLPYDDVIETFTLNVYGTTAAAAYANLETLARLLDQADRFAANENVAAVLLQYSPSGATVSSPGSPLQATVLGGDESGGDMLNLSPEFNATELNFVIRDVRVRLRRIGLWLHTEQGFEAATANNGDILSAINIPGGAVNQDSPTRLWSTVLGAGSGGTPLSSLLLMADRNNDIQLVDAEGMQNGGPYTSVTDAGNVPRNTNVLRYTPTGTSEAVSNTAIVGFNAGVKRMAVFANVRNNSATTTFRVRVRINIASGILMGAVYTPSVVIPVSFGPQWVFLGMVALNIDPYNFTTLVTASAASGSLDIDTYALLDLSTGRSAAIVLKPDTQQGPGEGFFIDHRLLTAITPRVSNAAQNAPIGFEGNVYLMTRGATVYGCYLATGYSSLARWRLETAGTVESMQLTVYRRNAYLVPV